MSKRQRIEGDLHRSMPASITVRAAEAGKADDGLLRLRLSVSSEISYLRTSWWEEPWLEVLGHKDSEVDLARYNGGAVVLANHDRRTAVGNTPLAGIGKIESAWLEGARLMVDLVISRREALADLRQDIADDLVRNVSVGYQINERVLTRTGKDGEPNEYRVTSWTPFEISLVDVPADATVGLAAAPTIPLIPNNGRVTAWSIFRPPRTSPPTENAPCPRPTPRRIPTRATTPPPKTAPMRSRVKRPPSTRWPLSVSVPRRSAPRAAASASPTR